MEKPAATQEVDLRRRHGAQHEKRAARTLHRQLLRAGRSVGSTLLDEEETAIASICLLRRLARFALLLAASWCTMAFTHEAGHIIGGWASGGVLIDYTLWPWRLPYSLFQPDPHPLVTLWAGPILGVLIPLAVAVAARRPAVWFVADFCLTANGSYLLLGWLSRDPLLDTSRLLSEGASPLALIFYGIVTVGVGYSRFRRDCIDLLRRKTAAGEQEAATP